MMVRLLVLAAASVALVHTGTNAVSESGKLVLLDGWQCDGLTMWFWWDGLVAVDWMDGSDESDLN